MLHLFAMQLYKLTWITLQASILKYPSQLRTQQWFGWLTEVVACPTQRDQTLGSMHVSY